LGGAHYNHEQMFDTLKNSLIKELERFKKYNPDDLIKKRHNKFFEMGVWSE